MNKFKIGGMDKDKARHLETFKLLGNNIRARRKEMKISQEELAFRVSSARNYIGCIERAEKIPSIPIVLDIASALECILIDLFAK